MTSTQHKQYPQYHFLLVASLIGLVGLAVMLLLLHPASTLARPRAAAASSATASSATASNDVISAEDHDGWRQTQAGWKFQKSDGSFARSEWIQTADGRVWHFDDAGIMQTGWIKVSGFWFYMGHNGARTTGWQKVNGSWYYLNPSGIMLTGWIQAHDSDGVRHTYYLQDNGVLLTGWQKLKGDAPLSTEPRWFFFNGSGELQTGWQKINDWWYLFNDSYRTSDGIAYVDADVEPNAMLTGWQKVNGTWYFLGGNGAMFTGW